MPHEFLEYERNSLEGIMLSAELLSDHRERERIESDKEMAKKPSQRKGEARASKLKSSKPSRLSNLPK